MPSKGGVSVPVFECVFNGAASLTSYTRSFDLALYEQLPNLYVVLVSKNVGRREIVAGFFIKTSHTHNDGEVFQDVLEAALKTSENLSAYQGTQYSFLPARLNVQGAEPLSEGEMLRVLSSQFLKHSSHGNA